jgi:hypothetical protein
VAGSYKKKEKAEMNLNYSQVKRKCIEFMKDFSDEMPILMNCLKTLMDDYSESPNKFIGKLSGSVKNFKSPKLN